MVSARYAVLLVVMLCTAGRAQAHRLDEYLQQTMLQLESDKVIVQLSLTPGVDVAAAVLAAIDTNHDNLISPTEQAAYAETVRKDLSLRLDGTTLPLRVVELSYPTTAALGSGLAAIALKLEAAPVGGLHSGVLSYENHHQATSSVYLVNALQPRAASPIHVGTQVRAGNQAIYQTRLTIDTSVASGGIARSTLARGLLVLWIIAVLLWGTRGMRRKTIIHLASDTKP